MARVTPKILARFLDDRATDHPMLADGDPQYSIYADELRALIDIIHAIPPPPIGSFDGRTNTRLRDRLIDDLAQVRRPAGDPWLTRLAGRFTSPIGWRVTRRPPPETTGPLVR